MKELRRDMITGDIVIYSSYRNKRPLDKVKNALEFDDRGEEYSPTCPFCRGNESECESLKDIIKDCDGNWLAKSVSNKFPILDMSTEEIFGEHEVIIESHRHNGSYYNMTEKEFENTFRLMSRRYNELSKTDGVKYVSIFKNSKRNAGASLMHPHSQIISFNIIPPEIEKEILVSDDYREKNGKNLYEDMVLEEEKYGKRVIYNGKFFIVFIPYATRYNGEVRIVSKNNVGVGDWNDENIKELSFIFSNLFKNMEQYQGDIPFNIIVHSNTTEGKIGKELRTHFHIIPRKYNFGGFELTTGLFVCGSDPDELAEAYRIHKK